jgi:hypothetical protein
MSPMLTQYGATLQAIMAAALEEYTDKRTGERIAHPYMAIMEFRDGKVPKWRDSFRDEPEEEVATGSGATASPAAPRYRLRRGPSSRR